MRLCASEMFQLLFLTHLHCVHIPPAPLLPRVPPAPRANYSQRVPEAPHVGVRAPEPPNLDFSWIVAPSPWLPRIDAPSPPCITSP